MTWKTWDRQCSRVHPVEQLVAINKRHVAHGFSGKISLTLQNDDAILVCNKGCQEPFDVILFAQSVEIVFNGHIQEVKVSIRIIEIQHDPLKTSFGVEPHITECPPLLWKRLLCMHGGYKCLFDYVKTWSIIVFIITCEYDFLLFEWMLKTA